MNVTGPSDTCQQHKKNNYFCFTVLIKSKMCSFPNYFSKLQCLQCVRHLSAVIFLILDTSTENCNSMHSTAFHRQRSRGVRACTDVDTGQVKWNVNCDHFYVWHFFARWYSVTVQFNRGGSFTHSSIKTLLLMHSCFPICCPYPSLLLNLNYVSKRVFYTYFKLWRKKTQFHFATPRNTLWEIL